MPGLPEGPTVTPDDVLKFKEPTKGYLCPLSANPGIEFLKFEIRDYESDQPVYMSTDDTTGGELPTTPEEYEDMLRSIKYTFPAAFLDSRTVRTRLEFRVGDQPLNNFRMIEHHYFKGKLVNTYDFAFGFCIPHSINTWEAVYDVPEYSRQDKRDYVANPYGHRSDSFYFVDDRLVMHNKASFMYADYS